MVTERRIARLITTDILIDIFTFIFSIFAVRYFSRRTVPTADLETAKALDRERRLVDDLHERLQNAESGISLRLHQVDELTKRLENAMRENTRLREMLNANGQGL